MSSCIYLYKKYNLNGWFLWRCKEQVQMSKEKVVLKKQILNIIFND